MAAIEQTPTPDSGMSEEAFQLFQLEQTSKEIDLPVPQVSFGKILRPIIGNFPLEPSIINGIIEPSFNGTRTRQQRKILELKGQSVDDAPFTRQLVAEYAQQAIDRFYHKRNLEDHLRDVNTPKPTDLPEEERVRLRDEADQIGKENGERDFQLLQLKEALRQEAERQKQEALQRKREARRSSVQENQADTSEATDKQAQSRGILRIIKLNIPGLH